MILKNDPRPHFCGECRGTMIVFEHWFTYTTPLNFTRFKTFSGMCVRLTSITFPVIWSSVLIAQNTQHRLGVAFSFLERKKTCGTTRYRIEGFDLNFHIDAEFALRDTGRCDSKKILHDPTKGLVKKYRGVGRSIWKCG